MNANDRIPARALQRSRHVRLAEPPSHLGTPRARAPANGSATHARLSVAFYSHDTLGLGHVRRNLLLAQSFVQSGLCSTVLMLAGAREIGVLPLAPGVDCVSLPSIQKSDEGEYRSRRLNLPLEQVVNMRSNILHGALKAFRPHLLVVDTEPRGAFRELEPALWALRNRGGTYFVLGMRDVRDDPTVVRQEWKNASSEAAIRTYYDEVWVYGDQHVFDVVSEYHLSVEVARRVRYTGYLDQRARLNFISPDADGMRILSTLPSGRMMLCTLGGGQDGAELARAFIGAQLPADSFGVVLTGSQMPANLQEDLRIRASHAPRMHVLPFLSEPTPLVARADRLVTMGGYNSTLEALSFGKRALIVPRVRPRQEQWLRADRLRARGLLDVLHPDELSSQTLGAWLASDGEGTMPRNTVDLGGLTRVVEFLGDRLPAPVATT